MKPFAVRIEFINGGAIVGNYMRDTKVEAINNAISKIPKFQHNDIVSIKVETANA